MQKGARVPEQGCAGGAPLHHSAEELRQTGKATVHELPASHPPPEELEGGHGPGPAAPHQALGSRLIGAAVSWSKSALSAACEGEAVSPSAPKPRPPAQRGCRPRGLPAPTRLRSPGTDNVKLVLEKTRARKNPFQTPPATRDVPPRCLPPACGAGRARQRRPGSCSGCGCSPPPTQQHPRARGGLGKPHPVPQPWLSPAPARCPGDTHTPAHPRTPSCPLASPAAADGKIPIAAGTEDIWGLMGLSVVVEPPLGLLPSPSFPHAATFTDKRFKTCFISPGQPAEEIFVFQQCQTLQIRKETGIPLLFPDSPSAAAGYHPSIAAASNRAGSRRSPAR